MATLIWVNNDLDDGFLPGGNKPLPKPMSTYRQLGPVAFFREQFHISVSRIKLTNWVWYLSSNITPHILRQRLNMTLMECNNTHPILGYYPEEPVATSWWSQEYQWSYPLSETDRHFLQISRRQKCITQNFFCNSSHNCFNMNANIPFIPPPLKPASRIFSAIPVWKLPM